MPQVLEPVAQGHVGNGRGTRPCRREIAPRRFEAPAAQETHGPYVVSLAEGARERLRASARGGRNLGE